MGLARALSKLGYCSRSQAFALIREGRVRLNGRVRHDPETPVRLGLDALTVDGRTVVAGAPVYLMLNKPRGVVTSAADEEGRQTVYSCLPAGLPWVAPVGRLDKASEGLLLLTNDSEWAARITAPESHLEKTYHVQITGPADDGLLAALQRGVRSEGEFLRARQVRVLRRGQRRCWLEIILDAGRNRHIRRMLAELDREVVRLVRVAIGPLALGELRKGQTRQLTKAELESLNRRLL